MLRCLKCARFDFCKLVAATSVLNPMNWPVHILFGPTQPLQIGSDMNSIQPIPVSVPSKAHVCSRLIAGIAGSNLVEGMDIRLLRFLYVV
jgi:hypothetical protein